MPHQPFLSNVIDTIPRNDSEDSEVVCFHFYVWLKRKFQMPVILLVNHAAYIVGTAMLNVDKLDGGWRMQDEDNANRKA